MFDKDFEESLLREIGIQRREDGQLDLCWFVVCGLYRTIQAFVHITCGTGHSFPLCDESLHDFALIMFVDELACSACYPG